MTRRMRQLVAVAVVATGLFLTTDFQVRAESDSDGDGLDDGLESELADAFFPELHFSWYEECATPTPIRVIFRARYLSFQGVANTSYIGINYVMLYDDDCGFNGHEGDNESFLVIIHDSGSGWQFNSISARAHWGTVGDNSTTSNTNTVWVSENKHANYVQLDHCGQGAPYDDCSASGPSLDVALYNAGEPETHLTNNLGDVYGPWVGEAVWFDSSFRDAGMISNQLYLDGYLFYSYPPEIDTCIADCQAQYDYCMGITGNNDQQCGFEQSGCLNVCWNYYRWDPYN